MDTYFDLLANCPEASFRRSAAYLLAGYFSEPVEAKDRARMKVRVVEAITSALKTETDELNRRSFTQLLSAIDAGIY